MDSGLKVGLRPKSKTNESFLREDSSAPVNGMLPRENKAARRQRRRDGHGQLEDEVAEQNLTTKLFGNLGDEPLVEKSWVASTAGCGEDGGGAGAEVGDASARVAVGWEIAAPRTPAAVLSVAAAASTARIGANASPRFPLFAAGRSPSLAAPLRRLLCAGGAGGGEVVVV